MKKRGHLFFIMGVSGGGKGTLRKNLKSETERDFYFLQSYVTREMRPGEIDGDVYHFITKEEFEKSIENGEFLEYELVHKTAYYGTKKSDIEEGLSDGNILFKEIDVNGLIQILENFPDMRSSFSSIFLDAPNEVLKKRFFERHPGGSENDLKNRLESTSFERDLAKKHCDYIIDATQSPDDIYKEIKKIIGL